MGSQNEVMVAIIYALWFTRLSIIAFLAIAHKRTRRNILPTKDYHSSENTRPLVSIIIPAFNEQKHIKQCITSCLQSHYPQKEIIIVDDGSNDDTYNKAKKIEEITHSRELIILQNRQNLGKSKALNRGISSARGSIIVTMDADTKFERPETLATLIQPLIERSEISATTANLRIEQDQRLCTQLQDMEYTNSLNSIKRAHCILDSIMILPGAMSAFRRKDLIAVNGFSSQTMAEDADITMSLLSRGKHLIFQADAIAITAGPKTFRRLMHQRIRWRIGQFQCLQKHSSMCNAKPIQRLIYVDQIVASLMSIATPILVILLWLSLQAGEIQIERVILASLFGLLFAGWFNTALCYQLDERHYPNPLQILGYISFFSVFNPFITVIAIHHLLTSQTPNWRSRSTPEN